MKTTKLFLNQILFCSIMMVFVGCTSKIKNNNAKIIFEKYENGNNKTVYQYLADAADSGDDYFYEHYYENGNLEIRGLENQQVRQGKWCYYYENNQIKVTVNFLNDTLNGLATMYDTSGKVIAQSNFSKGIIQSKNEELLEFIHKEVDSRKNQNWQDSLSICLDSVKKIIRNKSDK